MEKQKDTNRILNKILRIILHPHYIHKSVLPHLDHEKFEISSHLMDSNQCLLVLFHKVDPNMRFCVYYTILFYFFQHFLTKCSFLHDAPKNRPR